MKGVPGSSNFISIHKLNSEVKAEEKISPKNNKDIQELSDGQQDISEDKYDPDDAIIWDDMIKDFDTSQKLHESSYDPDSIISWKELNKDHNIYEHFINDQGELSKNNSLQNQNDIIEKDKKIDNQATEDSQNGLENTQPEKIHEPLGGSYREIKKYSNGETEEVHHMPADSVTDIDRNDGPAIRMLKEDHRQTASCGNSQEARLYRQLQRNYIEKGKFREALQMDIDDLHDKFGDKYDDAISEMLDYVDEMEKDGKLNG